MMEPAEERISDIQQLADQALELLDLALGRAVRLPKRDRELVRDHLLAPRTHLRNSVTTLRRTIEMEEAQAEERRTRTE
jgi:hypothetical protein